MKSLQKYTKWDASIEIESRVMVLFMYTLSDNVLYFIGISMNKSQTVYEKWSRQEAYIK